MLGLQGRKKFNSGGVLQKFLCSFSFLTNIVLFFTVKSNGKNQPLGFLK